MNTAHPSLLSIATRYLAPLLFLLSLIALYRGHNFPGGGFIGGLVAASAILLVAISDGWDRAMKVLPADALTIMTIGLITTAASGLPALLAGTSFMTGLWLPELYLPLLGKIKLGTPFLFDVGVYLGVIGFTLKCAYALGKDA